MKKPLFSTEAELVAAFCETVESQYNRNGNRNQKWKAYHETGGFDLVLVDDNGIQVGIEAKLKLNTKVLCQALPELSYWYDTGPDYRAVLVPLGGCQHDLAPLANRLGLNVLTVSRNSWGGKCKYHCHGNLPDEDGRFSHSNEKWLPWLPSQRLTLPDYVPDVSGGKAAPVTLTQWKIRAIKLLILAQRTGAVSRKDMKALEISPSRWCDGPYSYLDRSPQGYVICGRTPDIKAQHPKNWAEIEADFDTWVKTVRPVAIV